MNVSSFCLKLGLSALLLPLAATAQDTPEPERWNAKFQATYIRQAKPGFPASYSGTNSLSPEREYSYSFTSTAYLGLRLLPGTEVYFNPELVQGVPLSGLVGLGGLSNSELQKTAGPKPKVYRARLFVRQTWGLGGERESLSSDQNQLAGSRDSQRIVLTAGNLAVTDMFDVNSYANNPRTQFVNWAFLTHGAYDFAADARGYSRGAALEYYQGDWALRAGRFMQPREPNGLPLDPDLSRHYGDQIELEKGYALYGQPGKARLLLFRNRAVMGSFADALANAGGGVPDTATVRQLRNKRGWGVNLEQSLDENTGVFARIARSDGASEVYAFAEIDSSLSMGAVVKGARWGRALDTFGLAYALHGLSGSHRDYLAAGGLGFFVGDGRLNYRPESITEAYYSLGLNVLKRSAVSVGLQYIRNPAYNADRGPVWVGSLRLHTEF